MKTPVHITATRSGTTMYFTGSDCALWSSDKSQAHDFQCVSVAQGQIDKVQPFKGMKRLGFRVEVAT